MFQLSSPFFNKFQRSSSFILFLFFLTLVLSGCGGGTSSSDSSGAGDEISENGDFASGGAIEVTAVKVFPPEKDNEIARAKVTLNGELVIDEVRLVKGASGTFAALPQKYNQKKRQFFDMIYASRQIKEKIQQSIESKKPTGNTSGFDVTDVRVHPYEKDKLRGFAQVTLNDDLTLKDITIRSGSKGLYISFPSRKINDKYKDWYYPITSSLRSKLTKSILDEYNGSQ